MRFFLIFLTLASSAWTQESAFDDARPLTEQEEFESENYIHAGKADRLYYEMCNENPDKCLGEDAWEANSGMSKVEGMMPMVTKAYSMFSGTIANKVNVREMKNDQPVLVDEAGTEYAAGKDGNYPEGKPTETTEKTKEQTDYCGYLPMVVEGASMAFQATSNQQTQQNYQQAKPEAKQKASFESLAKMHQDKATASNYQFYGWGAIAGCYAVYAYSYGAVMDWKLIAKTAAATTIAAFYKAKVNAHKNKARALKKMASKLPGAGDCNPHTDTTCFCSEATSYASDPTNFMKYCVPEELQRDGNIAGYPCVDKDGKADVSCKCKQSNSCVQARFVGDALALGLNPAAMKNPLSGIRPLSTGSGSANLDSLTSGNLAMANDMLEKYKPTEKLDIASNPNAKKLAKDLFASGVPKAAAATLAKHTAGSQGALPPSLKGGAAPFKTSGSTKPYVSKAVGGAPRMESGGSVGGSNRSSRSSTNPFARKSLSSRSRTSKVDIIDFAEKATREAEITKDQSKPIFEIITYRYKMRAWKEFKEQMQAQGEEEKK